MGCRCALPRSSHCPHWSSATVLHTLLHCCKSVGLHEHGVFFVWYPAFVSRGPCITESKGRGRCFCTKASEGFQEQVSHTVSSKSNFNQGFPTDHVDGQFRDPSEWVFWVPQANKIQAPQAQGMPSHRGSTLSCPQ